MKRLIIATTNLGKIREIRDVLGGVPFELMTLAAWPHLAPPEETGRTFEDNARQKAVYYAAATGELTVAEDSGLEIDALDGIPGVESARFGGADTTYAEKFGLIYDALRDKGSATGSARFVCALALVRAREPGLLGAVVWWGCDILVLWASLHAYGAEPAIAVVTMAYFVGQLGNTLPLPGGVGGVEGAMVAGLVAFGEPAGLAIAGVLTYRALAFWRSVDATRYIRQAEELLAGVSEVSA